MKALERYKKHVLSEIVFWGPCTLTQLKDFLDERPFDASAEEIEEIVREVGGDALTGSQVVPLVAQLVQEGELRLVEVRTDGGPMSGIKDEVDRPQTEFGFFAAVKRPT